MSDYHYGNGNKVTSFVYRLPPLGDAGEPTIIRHTDQEIIKSGGKTFTIKTKNGGRRYNHADIGKSVDGVFHHTYVLHVPVGNDEKFYITSIKAKIKSHYERLLKQSEALVSKYSDLVAFDINVKNRLN